jgi:hypothetical protein
MSDGTFLPKGATPWSAYNTPRIWAMVENEDDPESWRQVAALGSMAGLLNDQRKRLELARDGLIRAWPPEQNKAAAAFVDMIDDLLFNMAENRTIADSNAAALSQVLEALRQAKAKVEPLYRSYLEKNDDWVPGWWDHAEDELDEKAREQMRSAERTIAQPANAIVAPDIYEFKPRTYVDDPIGSPGGSGSGTGVTPFAAGGSGGGRADISVPHDPPPALPESVSPGSGERPATPDFTQGPSGPSLAGVITPAPPGPLPAAPLPAAPPPVPPPVSGSAFGPTTPGLVIGGPGGFGGRPAVGGGQRGLPGSVVSGGSLGRGGAPTAKFTPPSWLPPPSGQPGARGSVGQAGHGRSASASMMPASPLPGLRRNEERGQDVALDPDNRWATEQGVTPVIEPSRVHYRHDPGPGVIGWRQ